MLWNRLIFLLLIFNLSDSRIDKHHEYSIEANNKKFLASINLKEKIQISLTESGIIISSYYYTELTLDSLCKYNKIFKQYDTLEEAYSCIIKLFEKEKIKIYDSYDEFSLGFIMNSASCDNEEVIIKFKKKNMNKDEINEKVRIETNSLLKEIKTLKIENKELKELVKNLERRLIYLELKDQKIDTKILNNKSNLLIIINEFKEKYKKSVYGFNLLYRASEYGEQYETYFVGCTERRTEKIAYYFDSMKKLSGNRFVLISSYGLLFYGLNEENKYSLISKKLYRNKILIFHELNENNFLLGADIYIRFGMGGPAHNNFLVERLNLNKNLDDKSALKFNCSISTLYEFDTHGDTYTETYNINDEFILNNKYFIALLDYYLIVVDIFNEKSKKYLICENSEETLCKYSQARLIKKNDNELEFLIVRDNQNTLFKLIENDKSFDLKIIGYYNK